MRVLPIFEILDVCNRTFVFGGLIPVSIVSIAASQGGMASPA